MNMFKRLVSYTLIIAAAWLVLFGIEAVGEFAQNANSAVSPFVIPLASALLAVGIGSAVVRKLQETDSRKYEFLTVMMHKFRTPLTAIKWSGENLHGIDLSDRSRENVAVIRDAAGKLEALTETLLIASELEHESAQGSLTPVRIRGIIDEVLQHADSIFKKKGIELIRDEEEVPMLVLDRQKIRFALSLLIDNALTFTPPGGKVHIRVFTYRGKVVIEIIDSGAGVLRRDMRHMFERFYRSEVAKRLNPDGLGVSLFLVRTIVNQNGGSISVSSQGEDTGTVFSMKFRVPSPSAISRR